MKRFEDMNEEERLLFVAVTYGNVPTSLILQVLQKMDVFTNFSTAQLFVEALPGMIANGYTDLANSIEDLVKAAVPVETELLSFYLQVANKTEDLKSKYLCLQRIGRFLEEERFVGHMLDERVDNNLLVLLLTQVFDTNDKIKRISLSLLKPLTKLAEDSKLKPIVSFLAAHKTEMISQVENISMLLKKSEMEESSLMVLLEQTIRAPEVCFETMIDLFSPLKSKNYVCRIAEYGTTLLNQASSPNSVKLIVERFIKRIIKYIHEKSCFQFFLEGSKSTVTVVVAGLEIRLSNLLLEKATSAKLWLGTSASTLDHMLSQFMKLSMETQTFQLIQLLSYLCLTVSMFQTQLNNIWGDKKGVIRGEVKEMESEELSLIHI